jgi:hypothetical protein
MKKTLTTLLSGCLVVVALSSISAAQEPSESEAFLERLKGIFANMLNEALAKPYEGLSTSEGIQTGLFPIRDTGASTKAISDAAKILISSMSSAQRESMQFPVDDSEWRNWSNVDLGIFPRQGVSLEEMSFSQKAAAWGLLEASLSEEGVQQSRSIMKTDQTLREINNDTVRYGEEYYYFTIMGTPSETEPWGWQLDGHHLILNFFVLDSQVVMTPAFWGGEPVHAKTGKYAGNIVLQEEQDKGLAFMQALTSPQQEKAVLRTVKSDGESDTLAAANMDNLTLDYAGIAGRDLTSLQKLELLSLIRTYIGNLREPHANISMEEIGIHIDSTYFAWVGAAEDDAVFYYRIHSPVVLIEFDHQAPIGATSINPAGIPTRDHIHTIVRTPNGNDYGKDLLAQHLESHPH